jgi:hypothetical protein
MSAVVKRLIRSASSAAIWFVVPAAVAGCAAPPGNGSPPAGDNGGLGFVGSGGLGGREGGAPSGQDGGVERAEGGAHNEDSGGVGSSSGGGGASASGFDDGSAGPDDGATGVGVTFNEPPGLFVSIDWVITGPGGSYSGTVLLGDAQSIEFVVGGISEGDGYTITLTGIDRDGVRCSGTSGPFDVVPGMLARAGVVMACPLVVEPATLSRTSADFEAGLVLHDD